MDKYKIDSHKLIYHVDRVHNWKNGDLVYPIYMEISPVGTCNHRCIFCGLDFMEYQNRRLDTNLFKTRLSELGKLGLKSVMYAGEGEPFLHGDFTDIVEYTKQAGIDVAITTNGTLFKNEIADKVLSNTTWIKVSINAATAETYAKIHNTKSADFSRVIDNLSYAVKVRREKKYDCTLGMQLLLLPENRQEVVALAEIAKDIGMDYLVVKPYSQHPQSKTTKYSDVKYSDFEYLVKKFEAINTKDFQVIFRLRTMQKWDDHQRNYKKCLALPFWSYIDAGGGVWGCSVYLNDERFYYGNINEQTFQEIWEGDARLKSLRWVEEKLETAQCRVNCRMDDINRYLWDLKNPSAHVNFI